MIHDDDARLFSVIFDDFLFIFDAFSMIFCDYQTKWPVNSFLNKLLNLRVQFIVTNN